MWSWATNAVKQAGASVAQFGQDCLDSVTTVDETEAQHAKLLFDVEVQQQQQAEEASKNKSIDTDSKPPASEPSSTAATTSGTGSASGWLPRELDFAGGTLYQMSKALVDRGAEAALQMLPDIDSSTASPRSPDRSAAAVAASATRETDDEAAVTERRAATPLGDPLDALRLARGTVHLKFNTVADDELRRVAEEELNPINISAFDLDEAETVSASVEYMATTQVGKRLRTARRECAVVLSDVTGELVRDEDLITVLPSLEGRTKDTASTLIDIVLDELAAVFAAAPQSPTSSPLLAVFSSDDSAHDWLKVDGGAEAGPSSDAQATVRQRCARVRDLIRYAQCEIAVGTNSLSSLASDAFHYAKRVGRPDVKEIKERSLTVRGDCYAAAAGDFCLLEEAAECVVALVCRDLYTSGEAKRTPTVVSIPPLDSPAVGEVTTTTQPAEVTAPVPEDVKPSTEEEAKSQVVAVAQPNVTPVPTGAAVEAAPTAASSDDQQSKEVEEQQPSADAEVTETTASGARGGRGGRNNNRRRGRK